jgi:anti-sigma factor RsiW
MTPCQRLKQKLFDLLDADVDSADKKHLETHLRDCPDCSESFQRFQRQRDCLRRMKSIKTSDHFLILLRDRIRRDLAGKSKTSRSNGFSWQWATVFGTAAALTFVGVWVFGIRSVKSVSPARYAGTAPVSKPAARPAPKPANRPVQYVLEDYQSASARPAPAKKTEKPETRKAADSLNVARGSFDELRSRLTPVSF